MPDDELPTPPPAPDQQAQPDPPPEVDISDLPMGGRGTEDESGDVNERVAEAEAAALELPMGGRGLDGVELDEEGKPVVQPAQA